MKYLELAIQCMGALETIDQFYCDIYTTLLIKLSSVLRLRDQCHDVHAGFTGHFDGYGLDYVDLQHQKAAFVELSAESDKLRWYGRVNTDGFQKIIRKICFLSTNGAHIAIQLETKLCKLEFASQVQCLGILGNLHMVIASITRAQQKLPQERSKIQEIFGIRLAKVNSSIPALLLFRVIESDDSLELGNLLDNIYK